VADGDWLDISDNKQVAVLPAEVVVPPTFAERVALVESCWARLSINQRTFLTAWRERRYNASAACRAIGLSDSTKPMTKWMDNSDFATVVRIWRQHAAGEALDKDRLLARQDDIVETLMTPKPILHQGAPTGFEEVEAGAASRANETLMKAAGLLKDKDVDTGVNIGPTLIVQIVQKDGTVIDATPHTVNAELPEPVDAEFEEVK
jgi:hypothetical protein